MSTIEHLPTEIMVNIFEQLNLRDRKHCRLVCRRWLQLNYYPAVVKDDVLVVDYHGLQKYTSPNIGNIAKVRIYVKDGRKTDRVRRKFFERYHQNVSYVHMIFHRTWRDPLSDIFEYWKSVQHLVIGQKGCDADNSDCQKFNLAQSATKLRRKAHHPCGGKCGGLTSVPAGNLRKLDLYSVRCQHLLKCIMNSASGVTSLEVGTNCSDSKGYIYTFLHKQANDLKEFALDDDKTFVKAKTSHVYELMDAKLTSLSLRGRATEYDPIPDADLREFENLKKLSLSHFKFSRIVLASLLSKMQCLTHVYISSCDARDDRDLVPLQTLRPNLTCFMLEQMSVSCIQLQRMIGHESWPKMKCFRLHNIVSLRIDKFIVFLAPRCPNLEILDIGNCKITDLGLKAICRNNPKLLSLTLPDFGAFTSKCTLLKELSYIETLANDLGNCQMTILQKIQRTLSCVDSKKIRIILLRTDNYDADVSLLKDDLRALKALFKTNPSLEYIASSCMGDTTYSRFSERCWFFRKVNRDLKFENYSYHCGMPWYGLPAIIRR